MSSITNTEKPYMTALNRKIYKTIQENHINLKEAVEKNCKAILVRKEMAPGQFIWDLFKVWNMTQRKKDLSKSPETAQVDAKFIYNLVNDILTRQMKLTKEQIESFSDYQFYVFN